MSTFDTGTQPHKRPLPLVPFRLTSHAFDRRWVLDTSDFGVGIELEVRTGEVEVAFEVVAGRIGEMSASMEVRDRAGIIRRRLTHQ